jgi:GAF domain-containing protein
VETVPEPEPLLASLTELGRRMFGAAACSLAVLDADEEHLVFRSASGVGAEEVVGLRLPASRGIAGWVVSSGQPIAVHDVRSDPRFARDVAESTGYVPRSILAAPMIASGEAIGVVEVLDAAQAPDRSDLDLVTLLATQAAFAIELSDRTPPPSSDVFADVDRLDPVERQVAGALFREFLDYLGRRGGSAGLV